MQQTRAVEFGTGLFVWLLCFFDQGETVKGEHRSFREQVRDYPFEGWAFAG